jgi:hypothetical protein
VNLAQYKALSVSKAQAQEMSALWARISAHHKALNQQYTAIAADFAAVPSAASAPAMFLQHIASLCSRSRSPVGVGAALGLEPAETGLEQAVRGLCLVPAPHVWARHVLGASASATAAAGAALQRLWDTLQDDSDIQNTYIGLTYQTPCMSPEQTARFCTGLLCHGAFVSDGHRMCQLAAQELRHRGLFQQALACQAGGQGPPD